MTDSFTPPEKTSPSAKTQRCEVGGLANRGCEGGGSPWFGLPAETVREGRPPRPGEIQPAALLPGASGELGRTEAPGAVEALGTLQLGALVEHEHCAGSQDTRPPALPRLPRVLGLSRGPQFRPRWRVPVAWDALSGG